jgi:site-specific DNA recombinase
VATTSATQQRRLAIKRAADRTTDQGVLAAPTVRVGIYARISQDRTGEGLGVDRQVDLAVAEAERREWQVVERYVDNNKSASTGGKRPNYIRMLADAKAGRIDAIVAYDNTRLMRNLMERAEFMRLADELSLKIAFVKGQADLETAHGRMLFGILSEVAVAEVKKNAERIEDAFVVKRRNGEWLGGPRPFGWNVERELIDLGNGKVKVRSWLVLNEAEAAQVQRGAKMLIKGVSLGAIMADWNSAHGLPPLGKDRQGNKTTRWSRTTVKQVLLRPRNAAKQTHKGVLQAQDGDWPAILDVDVWQQVERILLADERRARVGTENKHLLAGVALCAKEECGHAFMRSASATNRDGSKRAIYKCGGTWLDESDPKKPVHRQYKGHPARNAAEIDVLVEETVFAKILKTDATDLLNPDPDEQEQALIEQQTLLESRLAELRQSYYSGVGGVSITTLAQGEAVIQGELDAIAQQRQPRVQGLLLSELAQARNEEQLRQVWQDLDIRQRREVVRLLFDVQIGNGRGGQKFDTNTVAITER